MTTKQKLKMSTWDRLDQITSKAIIGLAHETNVRVVDLVEAAVYTNCVAFPKMAMEARTIY